MATERSTHAFGATRREWVGLGVLALPTLLLSLDLSVLYLALPHLSADLAPSNTQMLWIMDIYGFMIAGFLITMGTLGDRIGRRRLLMIGAAAFGAASVLAAYSVNAEMLILTRAVLGMAGATLMPSTLALISNMFRDNRQRAVAIAVWMSCFMAGMAAGPLIGGVLLEVFWWGSVFLLGVPVMAVLLAAAPALLPEYRDPAAGRLDLTSVALALGTVLPIVYGLKELTKEGARMSPLVALAAGLMVGLVFVRRQRRLSAPLLDLRLFRDRSFSAALTVMLLGTVTMAGAFLFVTQYLQLVEEMTPLQAGVWLLPPTVAVIAGSMLAPRLTRWIRPAYVVGAGLTVSAAGFGLMTLVGGAPGLAVLMPGFILVTLGIGPLGVICTDIVLGVAPPEKAGSASAISETTGEFGIAMGVAVMGSIGATVYRARMAAVDLPAGAGDGARVARETLPGAVAVAGDLPSSVGSPLLSAARVAFTAGLGAVAAVSAAAVVVVGAVAIALLRHVRPAAEADPDMIEVKGTPNE